jgi:hypothetical protein
MENVGYTDAEDEERCGWRRVVDGDVPAREGIGEIWVGFLLKK